MLIQTNADAQSALLQLASDITNTETTQVPQIGNASGVLGWLGIQSPGSGGTQQAALDLLNQLAGYVQDEYAALDSSDTPLTAYHVAKMKLIQSQVADARSTVQSTISDLDWSFGELAADALTAIKNITDSAVDLASKGLGINWTYVKIGGGVLVAILAYALYRRVRG